MAQSWKDLLASFDTKQSSPPRREDSGRDVAATGVRRAGEVGVILTDSGILAKKFCIDRQDVLDTINGYISFEKDSGREWMLLDTSVDSGRGRISRRTGWEEFSSCLNVFMSDNCIPECIQTPVFIIGGDDVIPIPKRRMRVIGVPIGYEVEVDMLYCFKPGVRVPELLNSVKQLGEGASDYINSHIQCSVGRFPVETGLMSMSFQDTVGNYLERCKEAGMCLKINRSLSLSTLSWLHCTESIMSGIPSAVPDVESGFIKGRMFVAPNFHINGARNDLVPLFVHSSLLADLCLFNLHGDNLSNNSNYYGEPGQDNAFSPAMAAKLHADLVCSLACYGARHTGYTVKTSILLSALYNNVMLFMGSCQPACLFTERLSYSDILAKLFLFNLVCGMPVGEALLRAKITYLQRYWKADDFSIALLTIGEFNLFGNPGFMVSSDTIDVDELSQELDNLVFPDSSDEEILEFTDTELPELDEAYITAQGAVDSAMLDIDTRLRDVLTTEYNLDNLKMCRASGNRFYYTFRHDSNGFAVVKTDKDGQITSIIRTK